MADNHYEIDVGTRRGRELRQALNRLQEGWNALANHFAAMGAMRDGDGTQDAHYALVTSSYGVGNDDDAHALYDEMNSTLGNSAALLQLLARTG